MVGKPAGPGTIESSEQQELMLREQVEKVIAAVRPAIQADGGDIFLREVDEDTGVVSVELTGACVACPASTLTLKAGLERILQDRVEGVTELVDLGQEEFEGTYLNL
jgi:Fe-S cluster biogenesis protein NfuA